MSNSIEKKILISKPKYKGRSSLLVLSDVSLKTSKGIPALINKCKERRVFNREDRIFFHVLELFNLNSQSESLNMNRKGCTKQDLFSFKTFSQ